MTEKTDSIFNTYKQYLTLISEDAKETKSSVYRIAQVAAHLTIAHVIDDALRFLKNDKPPTAHKINDSWREDSIKYLY